MELDKKCIGNDFKLFLYVYRLNNKVLVSYDEVPEGAVIEDLTNAKNIVLKLYNKKSWVTTELDPIVTVNELKTEIPVSIQQVGTHCVFLDYDKDNSDLKDGLQHYRTNRDVFDIVSTMEEATLGDVTVIGLVRAGIDGMSAFDVWKLEMGNNELTISDYLAYLQKPATDAVAAGELTLTQYIEAAQAAQEGAETAMTISASEASKALTSETNAKTSETNAKTSETAAGLSKTAAKTSEDNAKTSETNSKTSETNAKTSETAAAASAQQAAATLAGKANQADLVQLGADLGDNIEPALAEILNHLIGRIVALESIIKNGVYKNLQVDSLDVVKSFNIYGSTNMIIPSTVAPTIVPDFLGQKIVNYTGKVVYEAIGVSSVSDWKQTTN